MCDENTPAGPCIQIDLASTDYNCTECSSLIEILTIDDINNLIEFKCLNKKNNHGKKTMTIKEFLEKMKKHNNNKINQKNVKYIKNRMNLLVIVLIAICIYANNV